MNQFQEMGYNVRSLDEFVRTISKEYCVDKQDVYDLLSGDETVDEILNLMEHYYGYGDGQLDEDW